MDFPSSLLLWIISVKSQVFIHQGVVHLRNLLEHWYFQGTQGNFIRRWISVHIEIIGKLGYKQNHIGLKRVVDRKTQGRDHETLTCAGLRKAKKSIGTIIFHWLRGLYIGRVNRNSACTCHLGNIVNSDFMDW